MAERISREPVCELTKPHKDLEESCPSCGAVGSLQERYVILYDGNKVSEQSWLECESCGAETDCEELKRLEKSDLAKEKGKK